MLPAPLEHDECKWLMDWAHTQRYRQWRLSELLVHVPNGAFHGRDRKAGAVVAMKLRAQGLQAGVFDYILPVPLAGHSGLWLEMKRIRGGRVSEEQGKFAERMMVLGWQCKIARGWVEASLEILSYLHQGDVR